MKTVNKNRKNLKWTKK